ncbi:site-specific integrase [Paenibacillus sp. UMB7766-LJ446]|uniref:tyrosine-type recombinase/integrase n=1 Tax=Paenibacillus sp. UMB7766-LJ446 TaxID=3046313 RepID=UPI0025518413|nr:site-specific integrase [Paenibacillus sp. UMB7766-LJ446]MDK8193738.1 site-specific integrase [Paenibacillus sp. UMB7766-LJ446]
MAYKEKRGVNSWKLVVDVGEKADGSRDRRSRTIRVEDKALLKTKKKLETYLEEELLKFKMEVESGEYIAPEKMTFGAFVEEWRSNYASDHLEEKTLYSYEVNLKKHILPTLTHRRLDQIKPLHIVNLLKSLAQPGMKRGGGVLSSATIQMVHRIVKNIFTRAVEWKVIKDNPAAAVQKPKVISKRNIPYSEKEVTEMLAALQKEPIHWRLFVTMAVTSGLRRGELLGLEEKHIDLSTGVITVEQSVSIAIAGTAHVKQPKTANSIRKVTLPSVVLEELREYLESRKIEREALGETWNDGGYAFIFSHPDGKAFHQERPYLWFRNFLKKNGLRYIRFHDLRHTSATLLINQGVHAKIISERLGHGNISTTMNIYGHALQSADQSAADKFNSLFDSRPQFAPNDDEKPQKPL